MDAGNKQCGAGSREKEHERERRANAVSKVVRRSSSIVCRSSQRKRLEETHTIVRLHPIYRCKWFVLAAQSHMSPLPTTLLATSFLSVIWFTNICIVSARARRTTAAVLCMYMMRYLTLRHNFIYYRI